MTARNLVVAAVAVLVPVLGEGKDLQIASAWAAAPAKVDGTAGDWSALLKPLGDPPLVIGVQNDAKFLYLCVKTSDLKTKKQLGMVGLTVWANGEGKSQKGFGVRFPAAGGPRGMRPEGGPPPAAPGEEAEAPGVGRPPKDFELIGPTEDDRLRVQPSGDEPVAAAIGDDSGVAVLEFRIPLTPTDEHPLAIGAAPGAVIALGLETERPKMREGRGGEGSEPSGGGHGGGPSGGGPGGGTGGGPGGGYGGGRGGMGGGFSGGRHGGGMHESGREIGSPIKVWIKVTLAAPPAPAAAQTSGAGKQ